LLTFSVYGREYKRPSPLGIRHAMSDFNPLVFTITEQLWGRPRPLRRRVVTHPAAV